MLSELEVGQFNTFGFTVIRDCLSTNEFEKIEKAYTRFIANAYRYNYFSEIGTRVTNTFVYEEAIGIESFHVYSLIILVKILSSIFFK